MPKTPQEQNHDKLKEYLQEVENPEPVLKPNVELQDALDEFQTAQRDAGLIRSQPHQKKVKTRKIHKRQQRQSRRRNRS
jgi:hypothetical protein